MMMTGSSNRQQAEKRGQEGHGTFADKSRRSRDKEKSVGTVELVGRLLSAGGLFTGGAF
jgi:hypothetical protein